MKAIVVHEPGGVEVLKLEAVADPTPGRRDVIIEVEACGVCFHDIVTRNGTLRQGVRMPVILGHEIAGTVAAVGSDVTQFKLGDRIATAHRSHICGACEYCRTGHEQLCPERKLVGDWGLNGGYAEYVAVEDDNVALVPADISLRDASIVACSIGTILNALRDIAAVRMGETVLVAGAGGGLGMHAVQLARLAGAFVVAQTTSPSKVEAIRKAGAHAVVVNERGGDFSADVKKVTGGRGADVVVDNVGSALFTPIRRSIAPRGRWLLIGQLSGEFVPFNPAQLFLKGISMLSATSSTRKQIQDCLGLVARGDVRPVISHSLPLEEAARAHGEVEAGATTGRIVLCPKAK
jgi:acryloyl-coenzyme A reductase